MPRPMTSRSLFGNIKEDVVCAGGEFVGTFLFLLLAYGGMQASAYSTAANGATSTSIAEPQQLLMIAAAMGFGLLTAVWIFAKATGANLNPNISLSLLLLGKLAPVRFVLYSVAQYVAAIAAAAVVHGLTNTGPLASRCTLAPGISHVQGVFIEAFITGALVLTVLFVAVEKHTSHDLAPVAIGLALFAGHVFGVVFTGAGMNTARALGPMVVAGFKGDDWVWFVGPYLGAILATAVYKIFVVSRFPRLASEPGQPLISDDTNKDGKDDYRRSPSAASVPQAKHELDQMPVAEACSFPSVGLLTFDFFSVSINVNCSNFPASFYSSYAVPKPDCNNE